MIIDKSYFGPAAVLAVSAFTLSISFATLASAAETLEQPQSRPPTSSGASGGANPGGSGSNPGSGGSGSGSNPGSGGGSGYNPGYGGGYNPGANSRHQAVVFRDSNYRGSSIRFDGEIANLDRSGFNDEISSMRLRGTWLGCTDAYFQGRCTVLRNDVRDLQGIRMNDQISSLRPIR